MIARPILSLMLSLGSVLAIGCGAGDDNTSSADANLDTSGCTGLEASMNAGPVTVDASRPPTSGCWNIAESGLSLTYTWFQANDAAPEKANIGFYTRLNGADTYAKADGYACKYEPSGGLGHDTSGEQTFRCTASKRIDFAHTPQLLETAYGADGHRVPWAVEVAVSLDDSGTWDSLGGANYRFAL